MLDLSKYEAPIAGYATGCAVIELEDVVEFVFFETRDGTPALSVARFFMTYLDLAQTWLNSVEFHGKMEAMTDRNLWGLHNVLQGSPKELPSPSGAALLCSVMGMAKYGLASLIECYYLSASSMLRATQGQGQIKVIPLFSVQMPAGLIWSLLERIKKIVSKHPKSMAQ